ncbi:MAG: ribosome biogenesis GTPase Der [Bacteroidales bacterium]|nr:ribosome biogenesis GTPase Der [Bacteroidales bacterium]
MKIAAIVGRPNVGKSTLFNRLRGHRHAIVDEIEGVTRDRIYGKISWSNTEFSLIDTGGYVSGSEDIFESEIRKQVKLAISEADLLIFMVDVVTGVTDLDNAIVEMLRRTNKNTLLVVNKTDNSQRYLEAQEFYKLGFKEIFPISSINGSGTGDLLDAVVKSFPKEEESASEFSDELPRVSFVGRPNAGKSTLINALLDVERNIVTDIPGTTRDAIDTHYKKFGHEFVFIDTAGIRKKNKVQEDLEYYSVIRAIRAIEQSDVSLLLLDAAEGLRAQDLAIFDIIKKNHKGLIILVNKWDLVAKETNTMKSYEEKIREKTAPFTDIPILFISALNKQRIFKIMDIIKQISENKKRKISTSKLNAFLLPLIQNTPPPVVKDKRVKIKYISQLPSKKSVSFAFFCNHPQYVRDPYKRFLENRIREEFDFTGVPINIIMREK